MPDSPLRKGILHAIRDSLRFFLHVILIPIRVVLNALISGLTHLDNELGKV